MSRLRRSDGDEQDGEEHGDGGPFGDGSELTFVVMELEVGDTVLLRPGHRVRADGFVVDGNSSDNGRH